MNTTSYIFPGSSISIIFFFSFSLASNDFNAETFIHRIRVLMSLDNLYDSSSVHLRNHAHNGLVLGNAVLLKRTSRDVTHMGYRCFFTELHSISLTFSTGVDLISTVSCKKPYEWVGKTDMEWDFNSNKRHGETFPVVEYDFGIKHNILRRLGSYGCKIMVVPSTWPSSETLKMKPYGVLFSNAPGDPSALPYVVETVKAIMGNVLVFGICMGHRLLGHALGGKTYKMKFGHHGGNHHVRNLINGSVEISAQNHNYVVDPESLPNGVEVD
ncbi:unnamed protein product [Lactuca saligna]|uniref:carbamoyl-phosphate synthase (glutamine-hydrolyzing) n=1 Tax=Lactuca saligna TaxID=75948 RepID=A0AA35YRA3_LACSI|nr:unnamed protein product [Lactuca saligna]